MSVKILACSACGRLALKTREVIEGDTCALEINRGVCDGVLVKLATVTLDELDEW